MKRKIWMALAVAAAALGPAACGERDEAPPGGSEAPEAPAGVSASNGRLMLPAVAGNPGAVYFDLKNDGEREMVVSAVSLSGAGSAMMHETTESGMQAAQQVSVGPGETLRFEPGGYHVMVGDLADTLVPGDEAEMTVTLAGGDKVSFPVAVRAAGDPR